MADEPRRSGRATKGQHTRKDSPEPTPAKQAKQKGTKKKTKEDEEEDKEEVIRCVCGTEADLAYVCCDRCDAWQHIECMGLDPDLDWESKKYFCEQCKPQNHKTLLEQIARGERPWEKLFEADKKKKGKKGGATRKSRKSEVQSEEPATPKPESSQPDQPTPPVVKQEPDVRNGGEVETKDKSKSSEPPPQGKRKRQSTSKEAGAPDEKRRKSAQPEEQGDVPSDTSTLPPERKKLVEAFVKLITPQVRKGIKDGKVRVPDNQTEASFITKLALEVDHALVQNKGSFDGKDSGYFKQYTAIQFNIKKNPALLDGLLNGTLSKDQLAKMSSDEMAPEEQQRENAALREAVEKQAVLVHEEGPRIRRTHKGDELIEDEGPHQSEDAGFVAPARPEPSGSPTAEPPRANSAGPLKVETSSPHARQPSAGGFNIQQVWSSVGSPDHEHQRRASEALRRQSSVTQPPPSAGPGDDADVDRLLKDEDDSYSPADYSKDPSVVWDGMLHMPNIAGFTAVGRHVAGGDLGQIVPWNELLQREPAIRGRIDIEKATQYITNLRNSGTDQTNVGVLALTPIDDKNSVEMGKISSYFLEKGRWGVVDSKGQVHQAVRDIYVIPIQAHATKLPGILDMLEYCSVELPATQDMLLVAIIAKTITPPSSAPPTPAHQTTATPAHPQPIATPSFQMTPHAPQFSPVVPQNGQFPSPFPPPAAHPAGSAAAILGPHLDCPTAQQLLTTNPNTEILQNLRAILDEVPEARTDFAAMMAHIQRRNEQQKISPQQQQPLQQQIVQPQAVPHAAPFS